MKSHVDANYRFIAASNEVNARIAQRQQILALYITLTLGLAAALVGLRGGSAAEAVPVSLLALGLPLASVVFVLLNYRTERALTNLRCFLGELERLDAAHTRLPSYNTDPRWAQQANSARRLHNWAAALLVAGGNSVALAALWHAYPLQMAVDSVAFWFTGFVALGCVLALFGLDRWSYRPGTRAAPLP
jgi:hypothetical protein